MQRYTASLFDLSRGINEEVSEEDYIADPNARFFSIVFDRRGRLGWKSSKIADDIPGNGNTHIVEILCENIPDANLTYYQHIGVSYIFAGKTYPELSLALQKLQQPFGIQTLLLEGGRLINSTF